MNRSLLASAAMVALLSGCVSGSDFERLERQMDDLQDEITALKRQSSSKAEVEQLNTSLREQTDRLLRTSADVAAKVGEVDERMQNLQGGIEQTNHRIDRVVQQLAQAERDIAGLRQSSMAVNPDGISGSVNVTPSNAGADPVQLYQSAYQDYQRGNYDLAVAGFREFVQANPNSDLADNAAYWIGESLYSQRNYPQAIEQFNRIINGYPDSDKVPAALLKKSYSYIELGERAQAIVQLQYVVHEHPQSSEASLARQKLRELGIDSR